jgi:hypothetical protein
MSHRHKRQHDLRLVCEDATLEGGSVAGYDSQHMMHITVRHVTLGNLGPDLT